MVGGKELEREQGSSCTEACKTAVSTSLCAWGIYDVFENSVTVCFKSITLSIELRVA